MRVLTGPEALLEASGSHLGLTEWEAPTADRVAQFLVATGTASPEVDAALVPALMLVSMGPVLTNAGQVCSATARVLVEASGLRRSGGPHRHARGAVHTGRAEVTTTRMICHA
jgi:hypothetical protein